MILLAEIVFYGLMSLLFISFIAYVILAGSYIIDGMKGYKK